MDRETKFSEIKQAYKLQESELLGEGKNLFWNTEKGIFGTSSMDSVFALFKEIKLDGYKRFLDLGCGDGRVALIASLFTETVGIEYDEKLVRVAEEIKDKLGLTCEFVVGDYMEHDISQYDIVFINPDKGFLWGLDNKLSAELRGELYVYNEVFAPAALKKGKKFWYGGAMPIVKYTNE